MTEDRNEKNHWYAMSFDYCNANSNGVCMIAISIREKDMITWPHILQAKQMILPSVPPQNVVLIACTYLGHMSQNEFEGTTDGEDVGSEAGEGEEGSGEGEATS